VNKVGLMVVEPDLKLAPGSSPALDGLSVRLVDDQGDVAQAIRPLLEAGGIEVISSGIPDVLVVCLRTGGTLEQRSASRAGRPTALGARSRHAVWLTLRERQVLALLVEGASNKAMAKRLALRPNTVRTHVQNIMDKLGVHSRLEVVTLAIRQGLASPQDSLATICWADVVRPRFAATQGVHGRRGL
jgi:DNA-binding CsgD family transcriptional regulator